MHVFVVFKLAVLDRHFVLVFLVVFQVKLNFCIALSAHNFCNVIRGLVKSKTLDFILELQLASKEHQIVTTKEHLFKFFLLFQR